MRCAWKELLGILPPAMRQEADRLGRDSLQELRVRAGERVELVLSGRSRFLERVASEEDIQFMVNAASRYSPWSAATVASGYITAPGGHRIGICGECTAADGRVTGICRARSLCIRVAREFPGIGDKAPTGGSLLILGPPGSGKTTLLRELIRVRSGLGAGSIAVVDERGELFPPPFSPGPRTDVLTGCAKAQGVDMVLKTMGPACIAVDEITSAADCAALLSAGWCGVTLLATAHASSCADLQRRAVYRPLAESGLFPTVLVLQRDKSWRAERMNV